MNSRFLTPLPHRAVIAVSGPDAVTFLQGLVSNDVSQVSGTNARWAAFLTPQGKFLHDFFMVGDGERLLLECEAERRDDLMTRLKRYRLRSKADIEAEDNLAVFAAWGENMTEACGLAATKGAAAPCPGGIAFVDPRLAEAGVRLLLSSDAAGETAKILGAVITDETAYDAIRIPLGLPDGSRDMEVEKALLLENGFEELGGVDFKKGCYIGQELTARTHYRALIKKRLLPVVIEGTTPPPGTQLTLDGKDAGEMKSGVNGHGLALVRLATWQDAPDGVLEAGGAKITPHPADWMSLPGAET